MTKLPETLGFEFHGVRCYQAASSDGRTLYYIPGKPKPEPDFSGQPTLSLWVSDRGAILQLQTRWDVESSLLEDLKAEIARRYQISSHSIVLDMASVSSPEVSLEIGDGQGNFQVLKTSPSSGFLPYTTIFQETLTAGEKHQALSALSGEPDYLRVKYSAEVGVTAAVVIRLAGDVAADIAELVKTAAGGEQQPTSKLGGLFSRRNQQPQRSIALEDCLTQMEKAITEGRITLSITEVNVVSQELRQRVEHQVKQSAAHLLLQRVQQAQAGNILPDSSTLEAQFTDTETHSYSVERQTDVSSWFPDGNGRDRIQSSPETIDEPLRPVLGETGPTAVGDTSGGTGSTAGEKVVRLGFEPESTSLYSIRVTCAGQTQTLEEPSFHSVTLPAPPGEPLVVETGYSLGENFTAQLPPTISGEWVLASENVGLAKIVVDASARQTARAKSVRVKVTYKPSGDGDRETKTVDFDQRDAEWTKNVYFVTRSPNLSGVIEYSWQETPAKGSPVSSKVFKTENTQVTL